MRPIGDTLRDITKPLFRRFGFSNADLFTHWSHVVGAELAAMASPERILLQRSPRDNRPCRTLLLRVAPEHALEVQHQTPHILQQLNSWYGYANISRIKIRTQTPAPKPSAKLRALLPVCLLLFGCVGTEVMPENPQSLELSELSEPSPASAAHTSSLFYVHRSDERIATGDYNGAIQNLSTAITLNPEYAPAYFKRGLAWLALSAYDQALPDLTQAIELNPHDAEAYYQRGHAWDGKRQLDKALEDYTKAIERNPHHAYAYLYRAFAWRATGQEQKAAQDLKKAEQLGLIWGGAQGYILKKPE